MYTKLNYQFYLNLQYMKFFTYWKKDLLHRNFTTRCSFEKRSPYCLGGGAFVLSYRWGLWGFVVLRCWLSYIFWWVGPTPIIEGQSNLDGWGWGGGSVALMTVFGTGFDSGPVCGKGERRGGTALVSDVDVISRVIACVRERSLPPPRTFHDNR